MTMQPFEVLSCDKVSMKLPYSFYKHSKFIMNMIEELGLDLTENGPPQTGEPCILGDYCEKEVLDKVIGFLSFSDNLTGESLTNIQKDEANASRINYLSTAFPIKDDPQTIFKAILVGNYLDIPILLETGCSVVAKNMAGLSTEELREKFDIKDDFTEEERYHIDHENDWIMD